MNKFINLPFILLIRLYQHSLGYVLGGQCRFYPSCSNYAIDCFNYFLFPKAFILSAVRISKCHPWHPGGVDEVTAPQRINKEKPFNGAN